MRVAHLAPFVAIVLAAGACGGGGTKAPSVAQLGTTTTSQAPAAAGSNSSSASRADAAFNFSKCMRSHGITNFPDPTTSANGQGFSLRIDQGTGINPQSPQFIAAQNACKSLLPNGGVAQPLTPAQQAAWLKWAQCMRTHGLPNMPDPVFSGGGVQVKIGGPLGAGNQGDSQAALQTAQNACKSLMPGGGPG